MGKKKIVGLGNLCRLCVDRSHRNIVSPEYKYLKQVFAYLVRNRTKFYWIHFYGLSLYAIKQFMPLLQNYAPNIIISVDNTKWATACNQKLKDKYQKNKHQTQLFPTQHRQSGLCCTKANRDEFFLENINEIRSHNIQVIY